MRKILIPLLLAATLPFSVVEAGKKKETEMTIQALLAAERHQMLQTVFDEFWKVLEKTYGVVVLSQMGNPAAKPDPDTLTNLQQRFDKFLSYCVGCGMPQDMFPELQSVFADFKAHLRSSSDNGALNAAYMRLRLELLPRMRERAMEAANATIVTSPFFMAPSDPEAQHTGVLHRPQLEIVLRGDIFRTPFFGMSNK